MWRSHVEVGPAANQLGESGAAAYYSCTSSPCSGGAKVFMNSSRPTLAVQGGPRLYEGSANAMPVEYLTFHPTEFAFDLFSPGLINHGSYVNSIPRSQPGVWFVMPVLGLCHAGQAKNQQQSQS